MTAADIIFALGWFNAVMAILNGIAWMGGGHSLNAFSFGAAGMYALLVIPRYWP